MSINLVKPESLGRFVSIVGGASDPYAAYLAYDSFTGSSTLQAHTPEKGGAWTKTGGAINIDVLGGAAGTNTNPGSEYGYYLDVGVADVTITLPLLSIWQSYMGILFNYASAGNYWWYGPSVNNGTYMLFRVSGGTPTNIINDATNPPTSNSSATIKVVTSGDTINCYRDGNLSITQTIAGRPHKTGTKHGIYTGYSISAQIFGSPFTIE